MAGGGHAYNLTLTLGTLHIKDLSVNGHTYPGAVKLAQGGSVQWTAS